MPANLGNSAVATGLEKGQFSFQPKKGSAKNDRGQPGQIDSFLNVSKNIRILKLS